MTIDYQSLIDAAMLSIARKVLLHTQNHGIASGQSFYISFRTNDPGVILSRHVKQNYPEEITIILEHQFRDLHVSEDNFSVNLAFNNIPETIEVPFSALTSFSDPMVNFSLQFRESKSEDLISTESIEDNADLTRMKPKATKAKKAPGTKAGEVIAIDKFRKKTK